MSGLASLLLGLAGLGATVLVWSAGWRRRRLHEAVLSDRLSALETRVREPVEARPAPRLNALLDQAPQALRVRLARAGVEPRGDGAAAYLAVVLAAAGLALHLLGPWHAALVAVAGVMGPLFLLQQLAARRTAQLLTGLPHLLDSLRQLLTVGQSFQLAFLRAIDEAQPTVRRHLEPAARRIRNGGAVAEAVTLAAERIALPEMHMLAAAIRLNLRFGGAVGPVLDELAQTLRSRARIAREIAAATAETRASAILLFLLPLAAVALLLVVNADYVSFLWRDAAGRRMLGVAVGLQALGGLAIQRLMRVAF